MKKSKSEKIDPIEHEHKTIMNLYALFVASLMMSFIPSALFAVIAIAMFTGVMFGAYIIRKKAEENSLAGNHMTYIIRTIWIASFFALFTLAAGAAYLIPLLDYSAIDPCINKLTNMVSGSTAQISNEQLNDAMQGCYGNFIHTNLRNIIIAGGITAGPLIIYVGYRLAKGISRAHKNHRMSHIKSWF